MICCNVIMHSIWLDRNTQAVLSAESYPHLFLRVKLENCEHLCECKPIQDNCKLLKMIDYVARNSTSIANK